MARDRSAGAGRMLRVGGWVMIWAAVAVGGCAWRETVPDKFVQQAVPGATLTKLVGSPAAYKGRVVILGGVIVEEKQVEGRIWFWVRNRPLDGDYEPHRDATRTASESGFYWIMADAQSLPKGYRDWARLTVVGRVTEGQAPQIKAPPEHRKGTEPVLAALYLRGWSYGGRLDEVWESKQSANYIMSDPVSELRQGGQGQGLGGN